MCSIISLIAFAIGQFWKPYQLDVKSETLNGNLNDNAYMEQLYHLNFVIAMIQITLQR